MGLTLVMVSFYGCKEVEVIKEVPTGISQAEYDRVVRERDQAEARIVELEAVIAEAEKPAETPVSTPPTTGKTVLLKEWTGNGAKVTEPFVISKSPFVVSWSCALTGAYGYLGIDVRTPEGRPVELVANRTSAGMDETYIYEAGTFVIDVSGYGVQWLIQVYALE